MKKKMMRRRRMMRKIWMMQKSERVLSAIVEAPAAEDEGETEVY